MKKIKINESLELELRDIGEKFCVILPTCTIGYYSNWKRDNLEFVRNPRNPNRQGLPIGQFFIGIVPGSVEEWFEIIEYFIKCGYENRIDWGDSKTLHKFYSEYPIKKNEWTLDRINKNPEAFELYIRAMDNGVWRRELSISIKVDFNKLEKFRQDIKNMRDLGYKFLWREDRTSGLIK